MGSVLGRIEVETPQFTVEAKTDQYEIRRYPPQMAAEVTYDGDHFQRVGSRSGFFALAGYIGVLGPAENRKAVPGAEVARGGTGGDERQKIAMTAPVITETRVADAAAAAADGGGGPQKIAMTAPVITEVVTATVAAAEAETAASESTASSKTTMQFLLPASFTPDNTPVPTNPAVRVHQLPARLIGALTFSGLTTDSVLQQRSQELRSALEKAGYGIAGQYVLARYNDPFTIPWFRTNEILYPLKKDSRKESGS